MVGWLPLMAISNLGLHCKSEVDKVSLLMERPDNFNNNEHIIDITNRINASSSGLSHEGPSTSLEQDQMSTSARVSAYPPHFSSTSPNSSFVRRGNGRANQRSPLNSGLWISVELVLTTTQIVAAIIILSLSKHEHPHAPLKTWIVGYTSGCIAILPLLYWRFRYRYQGFEHDSAHHLQDSLSNNQSTSLSNRRVLEIDERQTIGSTSTHTVRIPNSRLKVFVEYFKMSLDCFFAIWFVVGNMWIFGGNSSSADAPHLYRLCIVFLTFSCVGYAMPFILCATICCCLPCIISIMSFREDLAAQSRGATEESINSLPSYKFKVKKQSKICNDDDDSDSDSGDGGVAVGIEKERVLSKEDAICCICLAKYMNDDELRELPCTHFFHKECVDKWLKINASCPLCKAEVRARMI